jgi:hypothetical protein
MRWSRIYPQSAAFERLIPSSAIPASHMHCIVVDTPSRASDRPTATQDGWRWIILFLFPIWWPPSTEKERSRLSIPTFVILVYCLSVLERIGRHQGGLENVRGRMKQHSVACLLAKLLLNIIHLMSRIIKRSHFSRQQTLSSQCFIRVVTCPAIPFQSVAKSRLGNRSWSVGVAQYSVSCQPRYYTTPPLWERTRNALRPLLRAREGSEGGESKVNEYRQSTNSVVN